jgi:hypothetical protein
MNLPGLKKKTIIDERLEQIGKDLLLIADIGELRGFRGWQRLEEVMRESIGVLQDEINALCTDPRKNKDKIIWLNALRTAQEKYLDLIDKTMGRESEIIARKKKLDLAARIVAGETEG